MKKRIDYIDGIKGVSALFVSMYHFILAGYFDGFVGYGTNYTKNEAIECVLNNFFSAFITNNSIGLYLFFVLIAIFPVISFKKKGSNPEIMGRYACKRYFQLLPLCFITSILMVILHNCGLTHFNEMSVLLNNPWIATSNPEHTNILLAIKTMLFDTWFNRTCEISSLWCLHMIFKGSLFTYAAYALFGNCKIKYLPTIVLLIISLLTDYYILFAFGSILGEMLSSDKDYKPLSLCFSCLLILIGFFITKIPNILFPFELNPTINGAFGSFIIIFSVIKCEKLRSLLSNKILVFLGRISFEIVIVHFIVMGVVGYQFSLLLLTNIKVGLGFSLILGIGCTLLSIPLAYLLHRYISPLGVKLAKKVECICFDNQI